MRNPGDRHIVPRFGPAGGHPTREENFIEKILKCKVPFSKPHQETKSTKAVRCCFKKCSKSILYIIINRISFPYNKIVDYWGIVDLRVPILTEADNIMSNASIVNNCFFLYNFSKQKKQQQNLGHGLCLGQS